MPEGHVLHRLARRFDAEFKGQPLQVSSPQGRFAESAAILDGNEIIDARAHGKHLFLEFTGGRFIHIHLGLYGKWRFSTLAGSEVPAPIGQVRLRIVSDSQVADLSGPSRCVLISEDEVGHVIARLGPDPLDPNEGDRKAFVTEVRKRRRAIGELVMDQSVIAGPGNIYRAESLFRVGISPFRKGANTSATRLGQLWDDLVILMEDGVQTGIITTIDPEDAPAEPIEGDAEASRFYVYHRTGRPCINCGTPVSEQLVAGRRLFWCSHCQR
ncbi:MAG: DNA-formamidopyrimidine glycosylase family protein [Actinomycetaceae bacterium]|nr:DNA-formamidopyrimidine glycosylase family protein [Actinomycetaceae bacterium]